ncbi:hypothetical protein [Mycolicibacterium fortuitum]|nr:hypothetical protein [Mycolicibacterium fortuitum]MDG5772950.1 hypothetical protein [Mycolicibacterium fortuitum]MDG5783667.1 hypothetical protein [Mycolicibacterium fortuitum]MDG5785499.1 hypothetical protein [Mycolicibacterium fortuitum]UBV21319.1 hypothetical protein H8Z59_29810 [Mycolicibacterium fortuitum]WAY20049.1 hypothetical protein OF855_02725 [Mycolicibacterium fortuitum]
MTRAQRSAAVSIANSMTGVARGWTAKDAVFNPPVPAMPVGPSRPKIGRWRHALAMVRSALAAVPRPDLKRPYYPPPREGFVEDAAMAREMWRL